jgi:MFS family permease
MSLQTAPDQRDISKNKLRKRNIHRVDDFDQTESVSSSEAVDDNKESGGLFLLRTLIPNPLRQCISGVERDMTQKNLLTPQGKKSNTEPVLQSSCSESDLSSSCPRLSDTDLKNNNTSCSSAQVAVAPYLDDTSVPGPLNVSYNTCTTVSSNSDTSNLDSEYDYETSDNAYSFLTFRLSYLFVTLVVMLADGLQGKNLQSNSTPIFLASLFILFYSRNIISRSKGTHLYVLYEGYGFSVASLYCLGFITGALTAPITGPLIDRFGRKKSALLYCALEVGINMLEQFPFLSGLIVSRVVGGITTNLLSTVFETWLDTEYRNRGFAKSEYETLMRDSVVVSNLAAIASGYLAHILAEKFGNTGPFEGAVTCTAVAFAVIFFLWNENYGKLGQDNEEGEENKPKSPLTQLGDTLTFIRSDSRVLRVCITQGLTLGSLHIFIFLWSPLLKEFAAGTKGPQWGLDSQGEPAYGLIFGAFMAAGVMGGLCSSMVRKFVTFILSPLTKGSVPETVTVDDEEPVRAMDIEFQGALCYFLCAVLLLAPSLMPASGEYTFSIALFSFIAYEFSVGIYSPCEGVMRSIYIPPETRGSIMTVPSIIVNVAVAMAVVSTELISRQAALSVISVMMMACGVLQLSLVSKREWASLFGRIEIAKRKSMSSLRSISSFGDDMSLSSKKLRREKVE